MTSSAKGLGDSAHVVVANAAQADVDFTFVIDAPRHAKGAGLLGQNVAGFAAKLRGAVNGAAEVAVDHHDHVLFGDVCELLVEQLVHAFALGYYSSEVFAGGVEPVEAEGLAA